MPRQSEPVSPPPMMTTRLPAAVALLEKLHREVDALEIAAGDRQIARLSGAAAENNGVVLGAELVAGDVDTRVDAGSEADTLGTHLVDAPIDEVLLHLEVGNAVTQKAADAVVALEHRHVVTLAGELLCSGETRGTRSDDGHLLAGLHARNHGHDETLVESPVDDPAFDVLDGHRFFVDVEHARRLARSGAHATGHLGEVVGGVKSVDGVFEPALVHEVVPVGDEVPERAAVVTEGNAAIHAA